MEKRTLLAIVVSIAILLLWDFFLIQPRVEKDATVATQEAAEPPATPSWRLLRPQARMKRL